jgi:hypothetical protein
VSLEWIEPFVLARSRFWCFGSTKLFGLDLDLRNGEESLRFFFFSLKDGSA